MSNQEIKNGYQQKSACQLIADSRAGINQGVSDIRFSVGAFEILEKSHNDLLEALKIVRAISKGDRKAIVDAGYDFTSKQSCSDWAIQKIESAIAKAEPKQNA